MLDRVLEYAYEHKAIGAVPTDVIDRAAVHYAVGDDTGFEPHPLTAPQVAALAAKVGERYPAYELLVLFMAYTGLRAAEVQGLEVRDVTLTTGPNGNTRGSVRVQRTKYSPQAGMGDGYPEVQGVARGRCRYRPGSRRDLLPTLQETHPHADVPTAVLWPRRLHGNHVIKPQLDWSAPLDLNGLQSKIVRPALEAVGLPASRPAGTADDGTEVTRHERCSAPRPTAHGGSPVADRRGPLHPGGEVAGAQQLRVDADDLRGLHTRARGGEPADRTRSHLRSPRRRAATS